MPNKFNHVRRHNFATAKIWMRYKPDYRKSLRGRGNLRIWLTEEAVAG